MKELNKKELNKLARKIRLTKEYKEWREKVINKYESEGTQFIKGMQVHHAKPFNQILQEHNIKTLKEAKACKELWRVSNGFIIKKGEHHVLSQLERMKYHSRDFIILMNEWLNNVEEFIGYCNECGRDDMELDLDYGGCVDCAKRYAEEQERDLK